MEQLPHVLACDIGNTTIRFAHVHGDQTIGSGCMQIGNLGELGDAIRELWGDIPEPSAIAAGSVNPAGLKALEAAALKAASQDVLVIGRELPLPIETNLPNPESIGTDRLCCAAAAFDHLGIACVVADFGTAVTIDCVNDEGIFMGGAILPGLAMGAESLSSNTAQLPKVEFAEPKWVFGQDTQQAIVGGLVYGMRGALRELTEAYATELGHWPAVIVTGGDAKVICPDPNESELIQARVDDLSLRGVAIAYYKSLLK